MNGNAVRNEKRRGLLKIAAAGAVGFVAGKILGPIFPPRKKIEFGETSLRNFRVLETDTALKIYSRSGEEIMTIGKE